MSEVKVISQINPFEFAGLTIKEQEMLELKLKPSETAVVTASIQTPENPTLNQYSDEKLLIVCGKVILEAKGMLGYKPKDKEDEETTLEAVFKVLRGYATLTRYELRSALDKGLVGEYLQKDEMLFFSASNLHRWIKCYIEETKKPVMAKHMRLLSQVQDEKPVPDNTEQKKMMSEIVNGHIEKKRNDEAFYIIGASGLYESVELLGIRKFSVEEKIEIYKNIQKAFPTNSEAEWKIKSQEKAYNRFIEEMAFQELLLSPRGQIVDTEGNVICLDVVEE